MVEDAINVPGHHAFEDQLLRLTLALGQHAVADKSWADADEGCNLANLTRHLH